jgi:membrane protease subunit HflC
MGSLVPIQKGRQMVELGILLAAAETVQVFGIELLDIHSRRIDYNESVRPKIYDRMISEQRQITEPFHSEGNGEAARTRGNRVRGLNKIKSDPTAMSRRFGERQTRRRLISTRGPMDRARSPSSSLTLRA